MKTSTFKKGIPMLHRARVLGLALVGMVWLASSGCIGGFTDDGVSEGNRCNPLDSHNECGSGLVCTGQGPAPAIQFCPENYCCAVDSTGNISSANPNCQPGCNGGAAAICLSTKDPATCAFASGMALPDGGGE